MAQPRREATTARVGLSHLLDNFEAKPPRKQAGPAGPMGLGWPAYPLSGSPRSHLSRVDSLNLLEFMSFTIAPLWTSLYWRYLRGKDGIGNPSLNLHLLCLIPKYLDLIFVGSVLWALLEDGCAWMGFESTWALAFVFLCVSVRLRASSFHVPK